jgi:Leu/Phe-tRNA-protein transferase
MNPHLKTLGAIVISKADYGELLPSAIEAAADFRKFNEDGDPSRVLHYAHLH